MENKYIVDFKKIAEKRENKEFAELIELLIDCASELEPIDFDEYQNDPARFERFDATRRIIDSICASGNYKVRSDISKSGLTGTISIRAKEFSPKNVDLFKAAVLASDSLEIEGGTNDDVVINLSFFNMMHKK